jgi:D-alanine-D-alanine ligase
MNDTDQPSPEPIGPAATEPTVAMASEATEPMAAVPENLVRPRKPRVAIVFGGRSSEHAVSCATAAGVMAAIDRDAYEVLPIGIAKDGRWVVSTEDPSALSLTPGHVPEVDGSGAAVLVPLSMSERSLQTLEPGSPPKALGEVDVVFPLLHGPFGEDGTVQGLLELADIRYVGSGVLASAVMMDKHYMKVVFAGHGLPIGPYVVITDRAWKRDPIAEMDAVAALGWPVFVKPARAGSSMGISKVAGPQDLQAAVELARTHDPKVVVEAGILGRELECGVLEGRNGAASRASEIGEIQVVAGHEFYDFEAKYLAGADVELSCPATLPGGVADEIRRIAIAAFEAAGCEGLARVDCFYTQDGDVVLNEINTMPGFTPLSMFPRMWAASGLDYPKLIDELIQLALARGTGLR